MKTIQTKNKKCIITVNRLKCITYRINRSIDSLQSLQKQLPKNPCFKFVGGYGPLLYMGSPKSKFRHSIFGFYFWGRLWRGLEFGNRLVNKLNIHDDRLDTIVQPWILNLNDMYVSRVLNILWKCLIQFWCKCCYI